MPFDLEFNRLRVKSKLSSLNHSLIENLIILNEKRLYISLCKLQNQKLFNKKTLEAIAISLKTTF